MKRVSVLHNALVRKVISIVATAIALSGLLLIASSPANASGPALICETNGNYCIGDPHSSLPLYDPVKEMLAGQIIDIKSQGGISYKLAFDQAPSRCVAASNNGTSAVIHACSGGLGIIWKAHLGKDGRSCIFQNQRFSGKYLSGAGNGTQFKLKAKGAKGWLQQFIFSSHVISPCG